jgi:hypothetical protein
MESFLAFEEHKARNRQIHWPKAALDESPYRSGFSLRSPRRIRSSIELFAKKFPQCRALSWSKAKRILPAWKKQVGGRGVGNITVGLKMR